MNRRQLKPSLRSCLIPCLLSLVPSATRASEPRVPPLFQRIDERVDAGHIGPPVALAGDAEFLRRVSLDLMGIPPSTEELKGFLADTSADKRARAVDRLLESPLHVRHLATTLDVMLMERRPNQNVKAEEWHDYLLEAVRDNKPLNQLLKEILSADGADPKLRAAARFYLDRGSEPNLITRDVGRIVFGRDMQCAQCHNHPLIEDYQQSDYHGLLAFFSPGYALTRKGDGKDKVFYAEKAGGDLTFDSVFVKSDKHLTGPRILGGIEIEEPVFPPGEEYRVKPAENVLPVPRFSRRTQLATLATSGSNKAFNENIANRLWAMMMGRGLVHPPDLHHPANPPSHPELLKLLSDELVALNFDARAFLRELALSNAYQRSIDPPVNQPANAAGIASKLTELKTHTEPLGVASRASKEDYDHAITSWHAAETTLVPIAAELDQAMAKHSAAAKKQADAEKAVNEVLAKITAHQELAKTLMEAAAKAEEVAKKLPKEKDLAAAAQKFVDRSNAMAPELAALQKANAEKSAALKKVVDEVAATVAPVEAARAKAQPLRETVRRKEQEVLAARIKMAESRVVLERHERRLALLETHAVRNALAEKMAVSVQAVVARREGVSQAQKLSTEYTAVIFQHQNGVKGAEQARLGAEKTWNDAQVALESQEKIATSVVEAFKATDAARRQLPDDPALMHVAQMLETKADDLRSASAKLVSRRDAASQELDKATDALAVASRKLDASLAEKTHRDNAVTIAQNALSEEESRSKALQAEVAAATEVLATHFGDNFGIAQIKPLTPEQLCWSILKVTGVYDRHRQVEETELDKSKPLIDAAKNDVSQVKARLFEIEQRTFDKLKGNVTAFVKVYAAGAGQPQNDFFATADQALFAANGGLVNGWVAPAGGNVSERMVQEKNDLEAAEDLYLTILSRLPTADESAEVIRVLTEQSSNRPASVQELVWALLTSAEFRFNH